MRMVLISAVSVLAIFFAMSSAQASSQAFSQSNSCRELGAELQLLRKAQSQIITGLAENHLEAAKTLDDSATQLSFLSQPAPMRLIHNMKNSARALHKRGLKGKEQAQSLDEVTASLIHRLMACLRK